MPSFVECVPNFSEGRDRWKLEQIISAIRSVSGNWILDLHMDPDHNRSVITFAGNPDSVGEAALRAVGEAVRLIDLSQHKGEHPRIGAADVVPFVPLLGVSMEECIRIAHQTGMEIWNRYGVPVYFYEAAALRPEHRNLAEIRHGSLEELKNEVLDNPARQPDVGGPQLHSTAGATAVGAREFLIAFNVNLNTPDVRIAKQIAQMIRSSTGGLPSLKAIGVRMRSRGAEGQAQVSMNLVDFRKTSLKEAFRETENEAAKRGITVASSELIGLIPNEAIQGTKPEELKLKNFTKSMIIENRLAEIVGK
ncbi:MAG: glutamate formimidoyltransferase [Acidobacteria bacterium RIFCSPLOWO2_12_FULL_54_10]|nr:MAG: glutamate formimidoyltransferase [Acidobacteria bacterium RIFCSPLOWO2_12_FULL_54_10]